MGPGATAVAILLFMAPAGLAGAAAGRPDGTVLSSRPVRLRHGAPPGVRGERIRYAVDGLSVVGYLVYPAIERADAGGSPKGFPLLLFNRGGIGRHGALDAGDLGYMARLAAAGPYLVAASQYRGNAGGEGRDQAGGEDVHDVLALAKLARARPEVDPARAFMLGFSRGGTMAWLAARAGVGVRAFATVGAPVDGARTWREIGGFMRRCLARAVGGSPARVPEAYRLRSPLAWCEEVEVPVLILHGQGDRTIRVGQSEALAKRLSAIGHPHELEIVPRGNHQLSNRARERDRRILDFFSRYR